MKVYHMPPTADLKLNTQKCRGMFLPTTLAAGEVSESRERASDYKDLPCLDNPGPDYSQHFFTFGRSGWKESPDLVASTERRERRERRGSLDWAHWSPDGQETNTNTVKSSLGKHPISLPSTD